MQIDSFSEASINYLRAANLKYREADCYFAIGTIHARSLNDSLISSHSHSSRVEPSLVQETGADLSNPSPDDSASAVIVDHVPTASEADPYVPTSGKFYNSRKFTRAARER